MRWAMRLVAAAAVLAAGMGQAQPAPKRLALVMANADYDGAAGIDLGDAAIAAAIAADRVPDLRNTRNDAADMRDALVRLGFQVDISLDKDRAGMSEAIAAFGAKVATAPDDAFILIYYSGHAIQVDGANFLIPAGARMPRERFGAMPSQQARTLLNGVAVSTGELLDQFTERGVQGVNILILDSCRNNPWERARYGTTRSAAGTRGLQGLTPNLSRTVVALSTAPGEVAQDGADRNSPYTAVLKDYIVRPGLSVSTMFDRVGGEVERATRGVQTPWYQSASIGEVCLAGCTQAASADPPPPAFDVGQLDAQVRDGVIKARAAEQRAKSSAEGARNMVRIAEEYAAGAKRGSPGTIRYELGTVSFEGRGKFVAAGSARVPEYDQGVLIVRPELGLEEVSGCGLPWNAYPCVGRFAGSFSDGNYRNFGASYRRAPDGQWVEEYAGYLASTTDNTPLVLGVRTSADHRYAGYFDRDGGFGYGVLRVADGVVREGNWRQWRLDGPGVVWTRDGRVVQAGIFTEGVLTTPLGRQGVVSP